MLKWESEHLLPDCLFKAVLANQDNCDSSDLRTGNGISWIFLNLSFQAHFIPIKVFNQLNYFAQANTLIKTTGNERLEVEWKAYSNEDAIIPSSATMSVNYKDYIHIHTVLYCTLVYPKTNTVTQYKDWNGKSDFEFSIKLLKIPSQQQNTNPLVRSESQ